MLKFRVIDSENLPLGQFNLNPTTFGMGFKDKNTVMITGEGFEPILMTVIADDSGVPLFINVNGQTVVVNHELHSKYKEEYNFEWNYEPMSGMTEYQEDWNQTLLTKINQVYATNRPNFFKLGYLPVIYVPNKFYPLFKSLLYFDEKSATLAGRYFIGFYDCDVNYISFPLEKYKLTEELTKTNSRKINILNYNK